MPTLLLADENVTVQRVIALTFASEDIRVVTVSDGTQAVERMKTLHPDIVLAGTLLPRLSGYDLAKHMRGISGLKNVPVLLLTGAFETVDEEKLKASGANGIIEKPVEPNHVIARVRELLGLKPKPDASGRPAATEEGTADQHTLLPSAPPRVVTSTPGTPSKWEQLRNQSGLESDTESLEDASTRPDDYLDTLDAAFDTLDHQLSGHESSPKPSRNPSGPLGQSSGAPDPRSPGRLPQNGAHTTGNPVFEVDDEWFAAGDSEARAAARAGRREFQEDLRDPALQVPAPEGAPNPIFEVDDDWFAEDDKARAVKADEQKMLAAEMGIYDVEFAEAPTAPNAPPPVSDLDFDFGIEDFKALQSPEQPPVAAAPQLEPAAIEPAAIEPAGIEPAPPPLVAVRPIEPAAPAAASATVAADFAQLLAFEQGEHPEPPMPPPPEIRVVAPEVTDKMLEQIATQVADRLSAGVFADQLKEAMMTTVRDTVRIIAYETSERIVREIAVESTDRIVRDVASQASERVAREVATDAAGRVVRDVASATSERIVRDAAEASERIAHDVAFEASERIVRDVASETSQRIAREVAAATSQQIVREVVAETSERLIRDEIERIKSKHQ